MKKHINLLHKNKKYQEIEKKFYYLRRVTLVVGGLALCIVLVAYAIGFQLRKQYTVLLTQKERYLRELLVDKDNQEKIVYVDNKAQFVKKTLQRDLNFTPYYAILKQGLFDVLDSASTQSATLEEIHFDNKHTIETRLNIYNDASLAIFLGALENEQFLDHFQSIQLTKFTSVGNKELYSATIKGVFKPLKNEITNL